MAVDALLALQALVTKTASFNGAGLNMPGGTPLFGMFARVIYSAAANASGSNTLVWSVEHSDDNATFYALASGAADVVTLTTVAQAGELFIPFETRKPFVRLVLTVAGGGTSPTVNYQGDITLTKP